MGNSAQHKLPNPGTRIMLSQIVRRITGLLIVLLAVGLVAFVLFRFAGDPVASLVDQDSSLEHRNEVADKLGLNEAIHVQYFRFVLNVCQGDFGISYQQGRPVLQIIGERLPATLELALISMLVALLGGVCSGVVSALRPDALFSRVLLTISLAGVSVPTFLVGLALIWVFAVELEWLPAFGRGDVVDLGYWTTGLLTLSGWKSLVLPALTLGLYQVAFIARLMHTEMVDVLGKEYVRAARARGLPERTVLIGHALPNALVPVVTVSGLQFGSVIAFAVVTESVFQWPGLGLLFIEAIRVVDIPVLAAYLLLIALVFSLINLLVDLFYVLADPRVRDATLRKPV